MGSNPSVSAIESPARAGFFNGAEGWPTPRCCCIPHETFRKRHSARDSAQGCLRQRASLPSAARTMHTALQSRIKVRARTVHNVSCPYRAQCIETCTPPVRTRRNFRTRHPPEQPRLMPPARGPRFGFRRGERAGERRWIGAPVYGDICHRGRADNKNLDITTVYKIIPAVKPACFLCNSR